MLESDISIPARAPTEDTAVLRLILLCRGAVQGVGFRPAVYRLATSLGLSGTVCNDGGGATVEVEGPRERVEAFAEQFKQALPPLARLDELETHSIRPLGQRDFVVVASKTGKRFRALIPADAAICKACREEQEDPDDRRHHYPFTTCTDCGPRYSLARSLPYDRERTSMAPFPLCADCACEYHDVEDRRFHAEPICCPACGPTLQLEQADGTVLAEQQAALGMARQALRDGQILAVKGLGGYQLACRADRTCVVRRLRQRKQRRCKPFAIMVRNLEAARELVHLGEAAEQLLLSAKAPILLAPRRSGARVSREVAPGLSDLGVMLPTTPLHVELTYEMPCALVMTSGNLSDEPICRTETDATEGLQGVADLFLVHDREVVRRIDDSVVRTTPLGPMLLRRSRGYVPEPLPLPLPCPEPVLALGGQMQTLACVAVDGQAFASQHVGDLDGLGARRFLLEVAKGLEDFLEVEAKVLVCDTHPDYASHWMAEDLATARGGRCLVLQHHLAHAAAVLGEHDALPRPGTEACAIVLDGTGYGMDQSAWGSELLVLAENLCWQRRAHGESLPLVGGSKAVREPWRVLAAALSCADCAELLGELPIAKRVEENSLRQVARLAQSGTWPLASGAGRFFEAAGSLFGLCSENSYEGEAAKRLEALASQADTSVDAWPEVELAEESCILPTSSLLAAAARRLLTREDPAAVASGLHLSYCRLLAQLAARVFPDGNSVALAGGCMVNRLLLQHLSAELEQLGFHVLLPSRMPPGDGGLAYGQVVLACLSLETGQLPTYQENP